MDRIKKTIILAVISALSTFSVIGEEYTDFTIRNYTYDKNGNVETVTSNLGVVTFQYDAFNRLKSKTFSDPEKIPVEYTYNDVGLRKTMTDETGTTNYHYDSLNRLRYVQQPNINPTYYEYDNDGRVNKIIDASGVATEYRYNLDGQLEYVIDEIGTYQYTYYSDTGLLKSKVHPTGAITYYEYDKARRLDDVHNTRNGQTLSRYHYDFDGNSNVTQVTYNTAYTDEVLVKYYYNDLNQLARVVYTGGELDGHYEVYTYDGIGNRLTKQLPDETITYYYDKNNRLNKLTGTASGSTLFIYDEAGNLKKEISGDDVVSYDYDIEGMLKRVTSSDTNMEFFYDGDGDKIGQTINGEYTGFVKTGYAGITDISRVQLEVDENNSVKKRYIYGLDGRLAIHDPTGAYHYVYDSINRSVVQLLDANNNIKNHYDYDAFGNISKQHVTVPNSYDYVGEERLPLNLIYNFYRVLHPESGRYLQLDPSSLIGGANPYAYADLNPASRADPLGLDSYLVSRPLASDLFGWGFNHNFIVSNANYLGDPNADIYSFGNTGDGTMGRVYEVGTPGMSSTTYTSDEQAWLGLATGASDATYRQINAPDSQVVALAISMDEGLSYTLVPEVLGGVNSNSAAGAIAQTADGGFALVPGGSVETGTASYVVDKVGFGGQCLAP